MRTINGNRGSIEKLLNLIVEQHVERFRKDKKLRRVSDFQELEIRYKHEKELFRKVLLKY